MPAKSAATLCIVCRINRKRFKKRKILKSKVVSNSTKPDLEWKEHNYVCEDTMMPSYRSLIEKRNYINIGDLGHDFVTIYYKKLRSYRIRITKCKSPTTEIIKLPEPNYYVHP